MVKTLKALAAEINADTKLGLKATAARSWSSTDRDIPGTRLRSPGKGRRGWEIEVCVARTGEVVCRCDTSATYQRASEVEEWLTRWRKRDYTYNRAGPFNANRPKVVR